MGTRPWQENLSCNWQIAGDPGQGRKSKLREAPIGGRPHASTSSPSQNSARFSQCASPAGARSEPNWPAGREMPHSGSACCPGPPKRLSGERKTNRKLRKFMLQKHRLTLRPCPPRPHHITKGLFTSSSSSDSVHRVQISILNYESH